jgi:tRNA-2-methylthio-N6-dimethylallyladenosine synthase
MPYLHLPVQSGSDRVLEAMNRQHKIDRFYRILDRLRAMRPDIALSSDFIVGFPGESERDFEATVDLVRSVGFAMAYSFKYSVRPGTPAGVLDDQVPEPVKDERLQRLQVLLNGQQQDFNRATVGKTLPVLLEKPGRRPGQLVGRTPYLQAVHLQSAPERIGEIAEVLIDGVGQFSLSGTLVQSDPSYDFPELRQEARA